MRTLTKKDCRVLVSNIKSTQLGTGGKDLYSRLFQEAYGVPFDMVTLLRKQTLSINDLERKLRMSRRTIFRYLLALEKTGCSVELDEKGYSIKTLGKTLPSIAKK